MPDNVDTAKAIYEAFGKGDMEALKELFAEDAEWVSSEELPGGGTIKGHDANISGFGEVAGSWAQFSVEPAQYIDGGDWVTVRGTQGATGKAGSFECPYAHLMRLADGKLARAEFYTDSAKAKAARG